jgi:hypothetical protein
MKKWLGYREREILGRDLKPDEAREVTNIARRITAHPAPSAPARRQLPRHQGRSLRTGRWSRLLEPTIRKKSQTFG